MKTIVLEDHGQDFLEWDIDEKGVVVGVRPFQEWLWKGTRVLNKIVREGSILKIRLPRRRTDTTLKYRVESVRRVA